MNKKEKTKELIINKTKELIVKNSDVTIKDIADACFINIAAVNYHFGSKDNLIGIVINDLINNLKDQIFIEVEKLDQSVDLKASLATMLEIIYNFTLGNTGVIRYLFLNKDYQQNSTNILIDSFFSDNDFTKKILAYIMKGFKIDDVTIAYAKYMVLFSAFSIPLFIEIAKSSNDNIISSIEYDFFKETYISEILKLLN
ncbi:MAG: TetR/AcrR family transcriptional regulator [Bacilli bacterium]|jgi:AcrR family transcriptional regulator